MLVAALLLATSAPPVERRCGWLHNPTPANWWLVDRDGEWTLSTQGSPGAPGWEEIGGARTGEWVETNGSYGYGCACASLRVDRRRGTVLEVRGISPRPLKACRADRRLPKP